MFQLVEVTCQLLKTTWHAEIAPSTEETVIGKKSQRDDRDTEEVITDGDK